MASVNPPLLNGAEGDERDTRERLRREEYRLRELREARYRAIQDARRLSDEQRSLQDRRVPLEREVEREHSEHRQFGRALGDSRRRRDELRGRLRETVELLRVERRSAPRSDRGRTEQLKREMQALELQQQTNALSLTEENALIGRLRTLRRQLDEAERDRGETRAHDDRLKGLEAALRDQRAELDRLSVEAARLRDERERAMEAVKAGLLELGGLMGEIRERARLRADRLDRIANIGREIETVERDLGRMVTELRSRRPEPTRATRERDRGVREARQNEAVLQRTADEHLDELLRRGRVTLGG